MKDTQIKSSAHLTSMVTRLINLVYPELRESNISTAWSITNCFATIVWDEDLENIKIRCNKKIKNWHEAALLGLLSHELSHTVQKQKKNSEISSDLEAIKRGMGVYLAVERICAGKYADHLLKRGKDRYLGYSSIRKRLHKNELEQLDRLLFDMKLIPKKPLLPVINHHDMRIMRSGNNTAIHIDGYKFTVAQEISDIDVKIVDKENQTEIYAGNTLIGEIDNTHQLQLL